MENLYKLNTWEAAPTGRLSRSGQLGLHRIGQNETLRPDGRHSLRLIQHLNVTSRAVEVQWLSVHTCLAAEPVVPLSSGPITDTLSLLGGGGVYSSRCVMCGCSAAGTVCIRCEAVERRSGRDASSSGRRRSTARQPRPPPGPELRRNYQPDSSD